jgi:hypothetical protein
MTNLLDGSGNPIESSGADEAVRALDGPDFGDVGDPTVVAGVSEGEPVPDYDFGAGELGAKVAKAKALLIERNLLPPGSAPAAPEGAEQPDAQAPMPTATEDGKPITGDSIDWSEFDLDLNYAHFYPLATWTVTAEGPKWVVVINEYFSAEKQYNGKGVDKSGDPKNLGQYITSKINSPPDTGTGPWQVATVVPATMGNGAVLFTRKVPIVLPDPKPLEKETKVDAPTDTELKDTDDAATKWAAEGAAAGEEVVATPGEPSGPSEPLPADLGPAPAAACSLAEQIAAEVIDGPDVAPEATA